MNCCNHDKNNNVQKKGHDHKGHMSHMWMMVLCCGAPLILLFVISLLGASFPAIKAFLVGILPFVCPVLMIGMIPMMFFKGRHDKDCDAEKQPAPVIEENVLENKRSNE